MSNNLLGALKARKPFIFTTLVVALGAGGGLLLLDRSSYAKPNPAFKRPAAALTVTLAAASQANWPNVLEASGAITPWQEAVIGAQVSGLRLSDVRVNVGDTVRRGQVLAVFDTDTLRADESRLKLELKGSGGISEQEVLQYVTQAEVTKAQLDNTRLQVRYGQVIAPDNGIISARTATVGAVSNSGQELFRMIRQSRLEWRGELTAEQMGLVQIGQRIDLVLPDGATATAKVRRTAPGFDSLTRLGLVYAELDPGSNARAGMYVNGSVTLSQSNAITVPAVSVIVRDGRSYVPKVGAEQRITLQPVRVGRRQDNAVEILSGVKLGDRVAVQGAGFLNDDDIVRIISNTTPAGKEE
jgi:RND family efflux transporter MFP subunit